MFLSVVIPMYNCEKYLDSLFETINKTVELNIEFILIDDGSNDQTLILCRQYSLNNEKIVIIHNDNRGVSHSRNCGIKEAKGDYIMFLDSDDSLKDGWFELIQNVVKRYGELDIFVFSNNVNNNKPSKSEIVKTIIGYPNNFKCNYLGAPWSKVYKRDFLLNNNIFFDENVINGEDALFNLEVFLRTDSFHFESISIYSYRINYSSATHTFDKRFLDSNQRYLMLLESLLNITNSIDKDTRKIFLDYSFANSMYLLTGRISKIGSQRERLNVVMQFYKNTYYKNMLKIVMPSRKLGMPKIFIYYAVKYHMLYFVECVIPLFRRCKNRESYWVEV